MRLNSERDICDGVWRLALLCQRVAMRPINHGYFRSRLARLHQASWTRRRAGPGRKEGRYDRPLDGVSLYIRHDFFGWLHAGSVGGWAALNLILTQHIVSDHRNLRDYERALYHILFF